MTTPKRAILGGLAVLVIGASAFVVSRDVFSEDAPIEAQASPDPPIAAQASPSATPVVIERPPHPSIVARMTAVAEDNEKPLFVGELNGITFIGEGTPFPEPAIDCTNGELRGLHDIEARTAVIDSPLNFGTDAVPADLQIVVENATVCGEDVISVGRVYAGSDLRRLSIVRLVQQPVFSAVAPRDRLETVSLGNRNAVIVKSLYEDDRTTIYMYDDDGTAWAVIAELISEDDVRGIMEDVR